MIKVQAKQLNQFDDDFVEEYQKLRKQLLKLYNSPLNSLVTEVRVYRDFKAFQQFINQFSQKVMNIDNVIDFIEVSVDTFLNSDYNYDVLDSTQKKQSVSVTDFSSCPIYTLAKKLIVVRGERKLLEHYSDRFSFGQNVHEIMNISMKLAKSMKELNMESEVWIAMKLSSGYWLVGRADLVDFNNNIVVDIKTFREQKIDKKDDSTIRMFNYTLNQLTLYMTALSLWSGKVFRGYIYYIINSFDSRKVKKDVRFVRFNQKRAKLLLTVANLLPVLFTDDEKLLLKNILLLYNALKSVFGEGESKIWGDYCKFCPFNPLSRRYKTAKRGNGWEGLFTCPIPLLKEGKLPSLNGKGGLTALKDSKRVLRLLRIKTELI